MSTTQDLRPTEAVRKVEKGGSAREQGDAEAQTSALDQGAIPDDRPPEPGVQRSTGPSFADIRSGLIVFLVAVPLCLGVATASGAPPLSGLIAGMVGGVVVALLSGSQLSVAGPAAGLTVIVLGGIEKLGFPAFLAAVVLAGGLQVVLGLLRLGSLAQLVPNSVVRGMLAAIGLILLLKQIPHALGYDADYVGDEGFLQPDGQNTFSEILVALNALHPGAVIVTLCAALGLFLWRDYGSVRLTRFVPRELIAVAVGLVTAQLLSGSSFALKTDQFVHILSVDSLSELSSLWVAPSLAALSDAAVWKLAFTLAMVASIESLLSVEATDRLDPQRRATPLNRELVAQGVGNMVSGGLGGLPVTAVVVRSFTNVQAGARTRWSAVVHGVLLMLATLVLAGLLNQVPLAGLAVVLIMVGYKLTPPKLYKQIYQMGSEQFLPFMVTVLCILFTDLLTGTLLGMGFALFFVVYRHYKSGVIVTDDGDRRLVRLASDVSFLHKPQLKQAFDGLRAGSHLVLDGTRARNIGPEILEFLTELETESKARGVHVSITRTLGAAHEYFRQEATQ
jgi:SulP family sulfate permease